MDVLDPISGDFENSRGPHYTEFHRLISSGG